MNHGTKDLWLLKYMKKLMTCRDEFIAKNQVKNIFFDFLERKYF